MNELTPDMHSLLALIDAGPASRSIPETVDILADAMEESGHPWAQGMRQVALGNHRPFTGWTSGCAWRHPIDDPVGDWVVPQSVYDALRGHSLQWEYKVYSKASESILALARAFNEAS